MEKGKFFVLDGPDGSGKGTQAKLLAQYLFDRDKRNHVFLTREPYNSRYYIEIRNLLKDGVDPKDNARRLTELFIKDRKVHVQLIEKRLSEGTHVVCDRYKYSTLAYQKTQGIDLSELIKMHRGILMPDLAIIIDIPAATGLKRIKDDASRGHKEVFERRKFMLELCRNFRELPSTMPKEKISMINGNKSVEEVFAAIRKEVDKILQ